MPETPDEPVQPGPATKSSRAASPDSRTAVIQPSETLECDNSAKPANVADKTGDNAPKPASPVKAASALRIKDVKLFGEYVEKVWASTEAFLATTAPAELDRMVTVKPLGDMPGIRALGQVCVSHAFTHVGEIDLLRTLLGRATASGA